MTSSPERTLSLGMNCVWGYFKTDQHLRVQCKPEGFQILTFQIEIYGFSYISSDFIERSSLRNDGDMSRLRDVELLALPHVKLNRAFHVVSLTRARWESQRNSESPVSWTCVSAMRIDGGIRKSVRTRRAARQSGPAAALRRAGRSHRFPSSGIVLAVAHHPDSPPQRM